MKDIEQRFQKAARHGAKVQIKNIERVFHEATTPAPALSQREDIDQLFDQAAERRAALQAQLLEQKDTDAKNAEIVYRRLEEASGERDVLNAQVYKMAEDLRILSAQLLKEELGLRERIQRSDVRGHGGQSRHAYRPSVEDAERQPTHVCEMSHQSLAELAMLGNHCAQRERLLREIMAVDGISWEEAHEVLGKFDEYNEKYYWLESLPYRIAITCAVGGGVLGLGLVFWKPLAEWYGVNVAGEELPEEVADIDELTVNQVGTWTWNWMEPMIGVASFALLCAQFSRLQLKKMNSKTYGEYLLKWRANRIADRFPQYDRSMLRAWAKHMPSVNMNFFPAYEKGAGLKGVTSGL